MEAAMPLKSETFGGDERLEACLVKDSAHLTPGVRGEFVAKVQAALIYLDNLTIDEKELKTQTYGPSTAAAVLKFKKKRKIINYSYQTTEDNIVGKMTIKALDDELRAAESEPVDLSVSPFCVGER
jgi:peptidoglycan hydrolase-like protein with peptidoglycan-binding domain